MNKVANLQASTMPTDLPRFARFFRRPGEFLCADGVPFEQLSREVFRHLLSNALPSLEATAEPFLLVQGAQGVGKTVTVCDAALRFGFGVAMLPVAMLASKHEGGATETLDAFIAEVITFSKTNQLHTVVILDDADLGIWRADGDPNTSKTINTNLITQRLQHLADTREARNFDGSGLPFILTGNDFTTMRSSLFRDGRAKWVTHAPTTDEKAQIAHHVLQPKTTADRQLIDDLARTYRNQPVAFWSSLKNDLLQARMDGLITDGMPDLQKAEAELRRPTPLDPTQVQALAKARVSTRSRNFLKRQTIGELFHAPDR